jgi:DNA-binding NarL/FixJ family response regulator
VYAACSAAEFVAMLGPTAAVRDRAALLDLSGGIEATAAALLGVLGYLPAGASAAQLEYGLREVARGLPYAPEPFDGAFHATRERGCLTDEERQILRLVALGYTQEQMEAELALSRATLQRRVRALKERLGLGTRQPLSVGAVRIGFLPPSDLASGK